MAGQRGILTPRKNINARTKPASKYMKTSSIPHGRVLGPVILAVVCLLALPQTSLAKDHGKKGKSQQNGNARQTYASRPGSSFILTLGTGYAGRGYYYGPPNSEYYYERPDVRFYATREAAPREYYHQAHRGEYNLGTAVQRALSGRGYYHGPIDGEIGPGSRRAITRYQEEQGLRVTGDISPSLLRSLGLN
jgi:peptidoglycan hydrolase-like protein with peptidoglycan-binding domain